MATAPGQPGIPQQQMDPLAQLRDIQQPGMIESWPPAPGWWLVAIVALCLLIAGCTWLFRRWKENRYRREALKELDCLLIEWHEHQSDLVYLQSLQRLLKRVALTRFPREDVASLTGEAWVQFLDRSTGSHDFSMGATESLIDGNYRQGAEINVETLQKIATNWIRNHHDDFFKTEKARAG